MNYWANQTLENASSPTFPALPSGPWLNKMRLVTTTPSMLAILIIVAGLALVGIVAWIIYRFLGPIALAIIGSCGVLLVALWIFSDSPRARVAAVRAGIERIPNVRMVHISDLDKQASDNIGALIEVRGKGKMGFTSLEPKSFKGTRQIFLQSIGPFGFCSRSNQFYAWWIDIGPDSPIPAARALKLTTVQAAISHYDDILSFVSEWPISSQGWPSGWPVKDEEWSKTSKEEIHFSDANGTDYFFCLTRRDSWSPQTPPGYSYSPSPN
jgi:hypothetical protein